jgi:hypothetical protein
MSQSEEIQAVTGEAVALLQSEIRGLREHVTKLEQWVFMLEVDANEMEARLLHRIRKGQLT